MSTGLSLILPCLNESNAIPTVLDKLIQSRDKIVCETGISSLNIIIVNDGSTDDSLEQLLKYKNSVQVISHDSCRGYGRALKTGFQASSPQSMIAFYDLDDTCQPLDLIPMINYCLQDDFDLVVGDRMTLDTKMPITRLIGNAFYKYLTTLLLNTPVQDCCSGFRLFKGKFKSQFIETLPDDLNFTLAMTITFLRQKRRYKEIPIRYKERKGLSKLNPLIHGPQFLFTLLQYCLSPRFSGKKLQAQYSH